MILTKEALKKSVATYIDTNKISVTSFSATYNNTVGLLDTIAKIFTIPSDYVDKLTFFDGEDLSSGIILTFNIQQSPILMAACLFEYDGVKYAPKIDKVGYKCTFLFAHSQVAHFGCLYFL